MYDKALKILLYCPDTKTGRIDIPPTVTTIAVDAFYNCSGLDSISIPSSLQIIDYWAFENCTGLRTLSIPASVNQINAFAFYNCSGLKALYVNSVAPIDLSKNDSVFNYINKSTCTLYVLSGLKAHYQAADKWKEFANIVEISDAVAVTPGNLNRVFSKEQRASMKRLSLKGSIDARDFKTMRDSFPMLEYLDLSAVTIVAYTGTGGTWSTNETVYFANKTPESAFFNPNGNTILSTVILPINLINVGRSSFNRCYNLKTIIIPPTVTTLERLAFYSCNKLFNITIPTSVTTIGYGTFIGCGFSTVTIPNGVKVLGDYAFQNCNNLEQVLIPASVDSIGFCTFTFNIAMKSFVVDGGNPVFSSFEGVLFDKARKT
ncbi:MAG: leucine-rich repeat domain-containing protein, partial [Bacteroidia bacterium]|nr:leucine-rich repeat domain-containing protein [Bacteroidia bacterium]